MAKVVVRLDPILPSKETIPSTPSGTFKNPLKRGTSNKVPVQEINRK